MRILLNHKCLFAVFFNANFANFTNIANFTYIRYFYCYKL